MQVQQLAAVLQHLPHQHQQDLVLQEALHQQYQLRIREIVQVISTSNGQLTIRRGQLYKMEMLSHLGQQRHTLFHQLKLTVQLFIFKFDLDSQTHHLDLTLQRPLELLIVQ